MKYKVIIVGAGVAGMSAALYLKRANVECCIIESNMPGGQINYTSTIENYPGFEKISGPDLALNIYNQLRKEKIKIYYNEVKNVIVSDDEVKITINEENIKSKYLILATGKKTRKLNVTGEEKFISKGISYCAICDGALYKNKNVVVVGGGESALEEALYLSKICKTVTIISRNKRLKASEKSIEKVEKTENISIIYNRTIKEFIGREDLLEQVVLDDNKVIETSGCFVYIGSDPMSDLLKNEVLISETGYIKTNELMQTTKNNIYAIGDVREKSLYQIISAINDSLIATTDIISKL